MAWIDLLLIANYETGFIYKRGIKVEVAVGQIGYGVEKLAKRWRWSKNRVLRYLAALESDGQIERQKNNVTTLITITNYQSYQLNGTANGQKTKRQTKRQTGLQTEPIKEYKEYKETIYSDFYDSELTKADNDENYLKAVKILFGENNLGIRLSSVLDMKEQLSYKQFSTLWYLRNKYKFSIMEIFEEMENWGNPKKNTTVYRTFLTFIKRRNPEIVLS